MPKKESSHLWWFPLDVDAFLNDDRTARLSDKEQGQWLLLLVKMWRLGARMPDDAIFISRAIGISHAESCRFKAKLQTLKLLVYDSDNKLDLISEHLMRNYQDALKKVNQAIDAGKASARARMEATGSAQPLNSPNARSNVRSIARLNDHRTDKDLDLD